MSITRKVTYQDAVTELAHLYIMAEGNDWPEGETKPHLPSAGYVIGTLYGVDPEQLWGDVGAAVANVIVERISSIQPENSAPSDAVIH